MLTMHKNSKNNITYSDEDAQSVIDDKSDFSCKRIICSNIPTRKRIKHKLNKRVKSFPMYNKLR